MYKRNQYTIQVAKQLSVRKGDIDQKAGKKDLEALGFQVLSESELYYNTVPPKNWKNRYYGDTSYHTDIVDERGITRVTQFSKNAPYETRAEANIINPRVSYYVGTYRQKFPNDIILKKFKKLDDNLAKYGYEPLKVEDQFDPSMREKLGWELAIKIKNSLSKEAKRILGWELFNNQGPVENVATKLTSMFKKKDLLTDEVKAGINKGATEFYQQARDKGVDLCVLTRSLQTVDDVTVSARVELCTKEVQNAVCMQTNDGVWYVKDLQLMDSEVRVYGRLDAENLDSQLERMALIKGDFEEVFGELLQRL